jgi:uncharacterized protein
MSVFIERELKSKILSALDSTSKVTILYGPRQVGKTTLIKSIISERYPNAVILNGEEKFVNESFSSASLSRMMEAIGNRNLLFIDEAQNITNIGLNIKILHDAKPQLRIILSGSSSLDLANKLQEPLTGRKRVFQLHPISMAELIRHGHTPLMIREQLDQILRYGLYPEVLTATEVGTKEEALKELSGSYLYKDVIQLAGIKYHQKIHDLLKLLALQTGSTVSVNKLSNALNISTHTVENYIILLEQSFVLFRLRGYSRNLSKEICKMDKIYFYDIGIRNAILGNFLPMENRSDTGAIWENFVIAERRKILSYRESFVNTYFWRTYTGAEIDYIEEKNGMLSAYEIKHNSKIVKSPQTWTETYPDSSFDTINLENFFRFLT